MSLHREQGTGGLQLLPQRLPLLLRQQRPRKGSAELSHPRSEFAAAAGTPTTDGQDSATEASEPAQSGAVVVLALFRSIEHLVLKNALS